ncbi:hypothetical protein HAX54_007684 [Datura stramonium]|uniref:Uncharacterized protein n=1 Tax=Datura stramonium TaxID=4076 RepID=A0ABS8WXY3_DATST|nr:hypothetical protein [Datura stramonium]
MAVLTHHDENPRFQQLPFMAQGHTIPMIDIARLLAQRGVIVTILMTPLNSIRFNSVIGRAEPDSCVFVCLGSLSYLPKSQMIKLALGLESSKRPFIWVVRHISDEFRKWLNEENFEERVQKQGILIHGWAPQVLILSHHLIGDSNTLEMEFELRRDICWCSNDHLAIIC